MRYYPPMDRQEASFVIRLWLEPRSKGRPGEWRWHVFHVQSGDEAHFSNLKGILAYLQSKSGVLPPG